MRIFFAGIMMVLFVSCCMLQSIYAQEYSLDDLYRIALEQSEVISIARDEVLFSKQEKNRALSALLPRLSAFGRYVDFSDDEYNDLRMLIQPQSAKQWGLRADQTFSLSFREFTAFDIARNGIQRSTYDLNALQETYLLLVAQGYYTVLMARKTLDIAQSNLERVSKYRDAASTRLKVGEITQTVLLRADSELSGAKSDLVTAQNSLALANAALMRLVGIGPEFILKEEGHYEEPAESLPELKRIALSQRADLKSLEYQVQMAVQQVSFAKGAYWPDLTVSGVYERADYDPESDNLNPESAYGAVSLVFPFFEGGLRRAEVRQAKVRENQAGLRFKDQKKTVGLEVETAYLTLVTRKGTLKYLQDQVAFAQDNYRGVSRQFSMGMASSIDVIDANDLLVSSERQLAEAVYSYQISILAVRRATGTFMEGIRGKIGK